MKKEEILEASRKENKNKDVYQLEVDSKGSNYACMFMLILAFIYFTVEIARGNGTNTALYSIITIYNAVLFTYKAIKVEKCRKLNLFTGIIWSLLTVLLILEYFNVL